MSHPAPSIHPTGHDEWIIACKRTGDTARAVEHTAHAAWLKARKNGELRGAAFGECTFVLAKESDVGPQKPA